MAGWGQQGTGWDLDERVQKVATLVWDTETLQWVRGTASGQAVSQSPVRALFDQHDASTLYIGKAPTGSASTDAVWQIKKIVFAASGLPESITYAAGAAYSCQWDQREALAYA